MWRQHWMAAIKNSFSFLFSSVSNSADTERIRNITYMLTNWNAPFYINDLSSHIKNSPRTVSTFNLEPLGGPIDLLAVSFTAATNQTYNTFEVSRRSTEHKSNFMKTAARIYRNHYFIDFHWRKRDSFPHFTLWSWWLFYGQCRCGQNAVLMARLQV